MTKRCPRCRDDKELEAYNDGTGAHGKSSWCRACMKTYLQGRRVEAGGGQHETAIGRPLRPEELTVCPRCKLRGEHECIGLATTGIGNWGWI